MVVGWRPGSACHFGDLDTASRSARLLELVTLWRLNRFSDKQTVATDWLWPVRANTQSIGARSRKTTRLQAENPLKKLECRENLNR